MIPRAGELEDGQAYEQEIKASLTLSEVDEAQEIEPPMDAPPVSDLEGGQVADKLSGLVKFLDDDDGPGRRCLLNLSKLLSLGEGNSLKFA